MKRLRKRKDIGIWVARLSGYLEAIRDMNDDHAGKRYWFWADMMSFKKKNKIADVIHLYLKTFDVDIKEIDLEEELEIIENHILDNYLQGTADTNNPRQCYVMRLHGWRIQDYITMIETALKVNSKDTSRWKTEVINDKYKRTLIFIKIKNNLIIINFSIEH
jgi:hypothetical protein